MFVHNKTLQDIFFPVVVMFNSIPVVAKAPILVLIMGNGIEPKITIAALVCFFPTLVNMVRGLEAVNPQAMELMRVLSASKTRDLLQAARCYASLPYLFSALRIAASMSVIGAVVGEWIGATQGIGAHDHPGDLQLRLGRCCTRRSSMSACLSGAVLPGDRGARAAGHQLAARKHALNASARRRLDISTGDRHEP